MDVEEGAADPQKQRPELRAHPRYTVDEAASLLLIKHNATVPCRVVDISLTGCRLRSGERFLPGIQTRVEISFKVHGLVFRFNGVAQWTDDHYTVGIRFVDVTSRRRDELAEILTEVAAEEATKAEKLLAEKRAAEEEAAKETARLELDEARLHQAPRNEHRDEIVLANPLISPQLEPKHLPKPVEAALTPVKAPEAQAARVFSQTETLQKEGPRAEEPAKKGKRERRTQSRHEVDTSAVIHLINVGSRLTGRILDLSVGGCHIRTDDRFPVGIYIRVETEFRLEGLPFRLGGVIQAIHNPHNVGIRFLDMSERKREYVEQLIEEIEEMRARRKQAEPGYSIK
jgi:hypothetical protein